MQARLSSRTGSAAALAALFLLLGPAMPVDAVPGGVTLPSVPAVPLPVVPGAPVGLRADPRLDVSDVWDVSDADPVQHLVQHLWDASNSGYAVHLQWDPPASNGGFSILAYNVYQGVTSGTEVLVGTVTTCDGCTLEYYDNSCLMTMTCFYRVTAVNAAGEGPRSGTFVSAAPPPPLLPTSERVRNDDGVMTSETTVAGAASATKWLSWQGDGAGSVGSAKLWMFGHREGCGTPGRLTLHSYAYYGGIFATIQFDPCTVFGEVYGWAAIDLPSDTLAFGTLGFVINDSFNEGGEAVFGVANQQLMWFLEVSMLPAQPPTVSGGLPPAKPIYAGVYTGPSSCPSQNWPCEGGPTVVTIFYGPQGWMATVTGSAQVGGSDVPYTHNGATFGPLQGTPERGFVFSEESLVRGALLGCVGTGSLYFFSGPLGENTRFYLGQHGNEIVDPRAGTCYPSSVRGEADFV